MSDPNELSIIRHGEQLTVGGDVDGLASPRLETELETLLEQVGPAGRCAVEMSGVTFMDSSALRILLEVTDRCRREGGDLVLVAPSAIVRRLFELSQLDDHFTISDERV